MLISAIIHKILTQLTGWCKVQMIIPIEKLWTSNIVGDFFGSAVSLFSHTPIFKIVPITEVLVRTANS